MEPSKKVKAASLWLQTAKSGMQYMTGNFGGLRVVIFPVKEKRSEKSPDFTVYFEEIPYEAKTKQSASSPVAKGEQAPPNAFNSNFSSQGFNEDDLPF